MLNKGLSATATWTSVSCLPGALCEKTQMTVYQKRQRQKEEMPWFKCVISHP